MSTIDRLRELGEKKLSGSTRTPPVVEFELAPRLVAVDRALFKALVAVAEAAELYASPLPYDEPIEEAKTRGDRLREALAALDRAVREGTE